MLEKVSPSSQSRTMDRFIVAGIEAVAEFGVDNVSVQFVSEMAKGSRPTFYSYFGDINGLLAEIWVAGSQVWLEQVANPNVGHSAWTDTGKRLHCAMSEIIAVAHRIPEVNEVVQITMQAWWAKYAKSTELEKLKVYWLVAERLGVSITEPVDPNVHQAFLQKLAISRAKSICDYIHSKNGGIAIQSTRGIPANGKTADARKVTVTLIKVDNSGGGTGTVTIGICDRALTASMQSRIQDGDFYFSKITVRDISSTCRNKLMDIYFLDGAGNQIGASMGFTIYSTSITVPYTEFSPLRIESDSIKTVAFEIRDK